MACNIEEHAWNCNCDIGHEVIPNYITDDVVGYCGLIARVPEDGLLEEFNSYILQYGGLEEVCKVFPYAEPVLNRHGKFYVPGNNFFAIYSNLYHIMRAKRRDKAQEENNAKRDGVFQRRHERNHQHGATTQQHNVQQPVRQQITRQNPIGEDGYVNVSFSSLVEDNEEPSPFVGGRCRPTKEEIDFERSASQVFVSKCMNEQPEDKTPVKSFAVSIRDENEGMYDFDARKVGNIAPTCSLGEYNSENWHPNDPANFVVPSQNQPNQPWVFNPFVNGNQTQYNFLRQHQVGNTMVNNHFNVNVNHRPGFVNEEKIDKETFFSVSKLMEEQDRAMVERAKQNSIPGNPNFKPNHFVVKTQEFPEGIDESHPEFQRVRQEILGNGQSCFAPEEVAYAHMMTQAQQAAYFDGTFAADPYDVDGDYIPQEYIQEQLNKQFGDRNILSERFVAEVDDRTLPLAPESPYFDQVKALFQEGENARKRMAGGQIPTITQRPLTNQVPFVGMPHNPYNPYAGPMTFMGGGYYFGNNTDWMLPTEYELKNGLIPEVSVVYSNEVQESILPAKGEEEIKWALVKVHRDENGVEYDEFINGYREVANEKPDVNSIDYKTAMVMNEQLKAENETYDLAKELARYDTNLADTLLWYKNNADIDEYQEFKRECQSQLIRYRSNDELSHIKSTVFVAGDKAIINPGKPTTIEELERIAKNELGRRITQKEKEQQVIAKYKGIVSPVDVQKREILSGKPVKDIVETLQSLTNMKIVCYGDEDKIRNLMEEHQKNWIPTKMTEKENYLLWKELTRGSYVYQGKDLSNFDKEFDEWWMKPRRRTPLQVQKEHDKRYIELTEMNVNRLNRLIVIPPEEKARRFEEAILKSWREFDKGFIKADMDMYEFLSANCFLQTRVREIATLKAANQSSRLFDRAAYQAELRKHSALRNFQDGKGFVPTADLIDTAVYQKKRQAFIDQIFKKSNRGTIT